MMQLVYITIDQAIDSHSRTVEVSGGGAHELLDRGQLESVLEQIQNDNYYPTFLDKITHLFFWCKQVSLLSGWEQENRHYTFRPIPVIEWLHVLCPCFYAGDGKYQLSSGRW